MTLTRETLEVLQGGTMGPLVVEDPMGPEVLWIVPGGKPTYEWWPIATFSMPDEEDHLFTGREVLANARKIALVNQMADVCVKAAEYRAAEIEYVLVAEHDDYNEDAVAEARRTLHKAAHGIDEAFTALEEARRGQA